MRVTSSARRPRDVAEHLKRVVESERELTQERAVRDIRDFYGDSFVEQNDKGHWVVAKSVRNAFRELTKETVVWDEKRLLWRLRRPGDAPGRWQ